jgi:replicative superfamily II helicase
MPANPLALLPSTERAIDRRTTQRPANAGDAMVALVQKITGGIMDNQAAEAKSKDQFINNVQSTTYQELMAAAKAGDEQAQLQLDKLGEQLGIPVVNYIELNRRARRLEIELEDADFARGLLHKKKEFEQTEKLEAPGKEAERQHQINLANERSKNKIQENKSKPITGSGGDKVKFDPDQLMNVLLKAMEAGVMDEGTVKEIVEAIASKGAASIQGGSESGKPVWKR